MSTYETLLLVHLLGAALFVSGAVVAGAMQLTAMRRERPSEVALCFRTARVGAVLTGIGSLTALAFGIWLAEHVGYGIGSEWVLGSLGLWMLANGLGEAGGRRHRRTREAAERLAREGDRPSEELRSLVADRPALALSYASTAALVGILVLMVWKPGAL